jgi:hypothetical protein
MTRHTLFLINNNHKSYSISFKIEAIKFVDKNSNRKSAKHYGVDLALEETARKVRANTEQDTKDT